MYKDNYVKNGAAITSYYLNGIRTVLIIFWRHFSWKEGGGTLPPKKLTRPDPTSTQSLYKNINVDKLSDYLNQ